jgi:HK97 gp10 family phage protein
MAGKTSVTIRVVSNRLPEISASIRPAVAREVEKGARDVEARAKQIVHVETGTLRRSIHTVMSNGGLTGTVGPSVEYGKFEEFGSRGRGPHPFMRPAAEAVLPKAAAAIKRALAGLK